MPTASTITVSLPEDTPLLTRTDYSQSDRDNMDESDFGDPENQAFPIKTAQDVINAASRLHNSNGDQAAIKARIKRIAKRKGFPLPQTWQEDDSPKERAMATGDHEPMSGTHAHSHPAFGSQGDDENHSHSHAHSDDSDHHHSHDTAATPSSDDADDSGDHEYRTQTATLSGALLTPEGGKLQVYMPIVRIDDKDWIIEGQATSENVDSYGTIFEYESMKKAFQKWESEYRNVREMHQRKAVGKGLKVEYDDDNKAIFVRARISKGSPDTWEKICDNTLAGFSVGVNPDAKVRYVARNNKQIPVYYDTTLAELSVVDAPGSPNCNISIVRADGMGTDVLDETEDEPITPETQPATVRAGATISAATKSKLHDSIGHTLSAAKSQMQNCGCEACAAAVKQLDPDDDDDIDAFGGHYGDTDGDAATVAPTADNSDMERTITSLIEKALSPVYARLQGIAGSLARSYPSQPVPQPAFDPQAFEGLLTRALDAKLTDLPSQASLDVVRTELSVVKGQVDVIAKQPMRPQPIQHASAVDKRLPTDPYQSQRPRPTGSAVADALSEMQRAGMLDTPERQTDAVTAGLIAQQFGGR